jgi:hypothetical protein
MKVTATASGRARRGGLPAAASALAAPGVRGRAALAAATLGALAMLLAGCGGGSSPASAVPSLSQGTSATHAAGTSAAKLQAAAQCIRQHGIPGYQDPVLTPSGAVYSDSRSIQDASASTLAAVTAACRTLIARAGLNPGNEPPAPPQLVQAGVRTAECQRAHGLPGVHDPTANTPYTPGHGFGMSGSEIPAGGKLSPAFQRAAHACQSQIFAEIRGSTLSSLGSDG